MRYFKIEDKRYAGEEMDRLVDRLFWLIEERGVFRVGYDRFCFGLKSRVDLGGGLHQENDFEHSLLVALILWLLDEFFGDQMPDVDFYTEIKLAFVHDVIEVILGDIPHNGEGDRDEKNRIEKAIMRTFLKEFPEHTRDELKDSLKQFYRDKGLVFLADKMAFVVMIAWFLKNDIKGNRRMMKVLYGMSRQDRNNFKLTKKYHTQNGVDILDAIYKGFLEMSKSEYYRPFFLLLGEALYRKIGEEIPGELFELY